jgi:hypothetical protein
MERKWGKKGEKVQEVSKGKVRQQRIQIVAKGKEGGMK